jgi:hypothetical protein
MKHAGFLVTAAVALFLGLLPGARAATVYKYKILYTFTGGADGGTPTASPVLDGLGNLYGITGSGGTGTDCPYQGGCGVAFELSPQKNGHWKENVLFNWVEDTGGASAQPLLLDNAGNLYGGTDSVEYSSPAYIFELTPGSGGWNFNPIYDEGYDGGGDCLVLDQAGDLYGCIPPGGIGELSPGSNGWTYTDLSDETSAVAPLSRDAKGDLYGTDPYGGKGGCSGGCGTAFQLTPNGDGTWTYHVIHYFGTWQHDGTLPVGGLTLDAAGNAYGGTWDGGQYNDGVVFRLTPSGDGLWEETVLHTFSNCFLNGCSPLYTLVLDSAGALYGTADGGDEKCGPCGVIFKLAPQRSGKWQYSVLHTFHGPEGADPNGVILDSKGNLFGTTFDGGKYGYGVVFELAP